METLKIFIRENNNEDSENDINKDNDNIEEQLVDYIIKEIKIKAKWTAIKEKCEPEAIKIAEELLRINKNKNYDNIETKLIYELIEKIREMVCNISKEKCKEAEIALELEEQNEFIQKIKKKSADEKNKKKALEGLRRKNYLIKTKLN